MPVNVVVDYFVPRMSGRSDEIVEVVVPGVACNGALYVSASVALVTDGTCAVVTFAMAIFALASMTPLPAVPNLAISPFNVPIF